MVRANGHFRQCLTELQHCFTVCRMSALQKACEAVGGQARLAELIGVSAQAVNQWVSGARPLPAERVIPIERATVDEETGKPRVTRHELRPDIYPVEQTA
jgi:DNA-binding transcriptional regulator YdaS (Cro superfamily)